MDFESLLNSFLSETQELGLTKLNLKREFRNLSEEKDKLCAKIKSELPDGQKHLIDDYDDDIMIKIKTMECDTAYIEGFKNMVQLFVLLLKQ